MTTATTRETPYHHGDLRTALVEEAFTRLRQHGVGAVSLRSVATSVGVSPSAAYHHFPDKDALLVAVGERANEEFDRLMAEAWRSVGGDDDDAAVDRFEALGRTYVRFAMTEPHLFRHEFGPLCAAHHAAEVLAEVSALAGPGDDAFGLLLRALHDLAARGLLRGGDVSGVEVLAWSAVHGFATLAMDGWLPPEAAEPLLDAMRRTIVARP